MIKDVMFYLSLTDEKIGERVCGLILKTQCLEESEYKENNAMIKEARLLTELEDLRARVARLERAVRAAVPVAARGG